MRDRRGRFINPNQVFRENPLTLWDVIRFIWQYALVFIILMLIWAYFDLKNLIFKIIVHAICGPNGEACCNPNSSSGSSYWNNK